MNRRFTITVKTVNNSHYGGETFTSDSFPSTDESEQTFEAMKDKLRNWKTLDYIVLAQTNRDGSVSEVFFNPDHIVFVDMKVHEDPDPTTTTEPGATAPDFRDR